MRPEMSGKRGGNDGSVHSLLIQPLPLALP